MRPVPWFAFALACRDFHTPIPFDECQPYPLECPGCSLSDDLDADPERIDRIHRCEAFDGEELDAVTRRASTVPADDVRFYWTTDGARRAALRLHDEPVSVCDVTTDEEWWGEILDCVPLCEHDPSLPAADPDLPDCASPLGG